MKEKMLRWTAPVLVLALIWLAPAPEGLKPEAWHMFAIFAATIAGILSSPIPSGVVMFVALALTYFTGTLPLGDVLKGFSSATVWMIFSAYVLSIGFVQSGLGRRIAYKTLSLFGGSSLGVAYSLGVADLIMAPAMPSVTARSGGIILPVAKSINQVLGSQPGPTGKRIGDFLIMTCFQITPITGAMFRPAWPPTHCARNSPPMRWACTSPGAAGSMRPSYPAWSASSRCRSSTTS